MTPDEAAKLPDPAITFITLSLTLGTMALCVYHSPLILPTRVCISSPEAFGVILEIRKLWKDFKMK